MKCEFCEEANLKVGDKTRYGAVVIYKIGNTKNGWFATLSPRTGGDPEKDFSIQLMPCAHLKYFSDINSNQELTKNYGIAFGKICAAAGQLVKEKDKGNDRIPLGTYGKCKHPDEHVHFKIFPYKGAIGQPFTTDSSFARKEICVDEDGEEFVKLTPVKKVNLSKKRFEQLANELIKLLK
ncbi:hypothetical protein KY348_04135 [Candidatus Woesearchaeota archaeon]|nr:hypothetical protein [Candidatus Woesearchaeota archaeon]